MTIYQPGDQQQPSSFPRILFDRAGARIVELSIDSHHFDGETTRSRIEAAFKETDTYLHRLTSDPQERPAAKIKLDQPTMEALIVGYLSYLTNRGVTISGSIPEHPLVQAFTRYIDFCQAAQATHTPLVPTDENQDHFLGNDDLSDLDHSPFARGTK